jgi:hypothetical protein
MPSSVNGLVFAIVIRPDQNVQLPRTRLLDNLAEFRTVCWGLEGISAGAFRGTLSVVAKLKQIQHSRYRDSQNLRNESLQPPY